MGEHLAHGVTVQTEDTGSLPDAHAVYHACSSDAQIQFHSVHPSHLPWGRVVPYGRWRTVQFSTAVDRRSRRPSGTLLLRRLQHTYAGLVRRRHGARWENQGVYGRYPIALLPCKDGYMSYAVSTEGQWEMLFPMIGRPELTEEPWFADLQERREHVDEIDAILIDWMKDKTRQKVFEIAAVGACGGARGPSAQTCAASSRT